MYTHIAGYVLDPYTRTGKREGRYDTLYLRAFENWRKPAA